MLICFFILLLLANCFVIYFPFPASVCFPIALIFAPSVSLPQPLLRQLISLIFSASLPCYCLFVLLVCARLKAYLQDVGSHVVDRQGFQTRNNTQRPLVSSSNQREPSSKICAVIFFPIVVKHCNILLPWLIFLSLSLSIRTSICLFSKCSMWCWHLQ